MGLTRSIRLLGEDESMGINGYGRVSTAEQDTATQAALTTAGVAAYDVIAETVSGAVPAVRKPLLASLLGRLGPAALRWSTTLAHSLLPQRRLACRYCNGFKNDRAYRPDDLEAVLGAMSLACCGRMWSSLDALVNSDMSVELRRRGSVLAVQELCRYELRLAEARAAAAKKGSSIMDEFDRHCPVVMRIRGVLAYNHD